MTSDTEEPRTKHCEGSKDCERLVKHRIVTATVHELDPYRAALEVDKTETVVCDLHLQVAIEWVGESENRHINTARLDGDEKEDTPE